MATDAQIEFIEDLIDTLGFSGEMVSQELCDLGAATAEDVGDELLDWIAGLSHHEASGVIDLLKEEKSRRRDEARKR